MIKAKVGDAVRSKSDPAMVNEALCHNIRCLIQSTHELGIEAKFWRDEAKPVEVDTPEFTDGCLEAWGWV
jgi:hypothetical protein